jgi:hypothetical protein
LTKLTEYIRWNKIKHTWETKIISKTNSFLRARKTNSYIEVFQSCHLYLQSFGISMLLQSFKKKIPKEHLQKLDKPQGYWKLDWVTQPIGETYDFQCAMVVYMSFAREAAE